jgi:molybdenum cofactor guanylyltransferase
MTSVARGDATAELGAIVLAGGRSRRMGRDKASVELGGLTLLERVVRGVAVFATTVVVVARAGQALPALPASVLIAHDPVADLGPLAGLAAGLAALGTRCDWVYLTATDMPFPSGAVAKRLLAIALELGGLAAVPTLDGRAQPLASVIHTSALARIERSLARGERRLSSIVEALDARLVDLRELGADADVANEDPELDALRDLDTEEDLAWARGRLDDRR